MKTRKHKKKLKIKAAMEHLFYTTGRPLLISNRQINKVKKIFKYNKATNEVVAI